MEGQRILRIGICDMWWGIGSWEVSWFRLRFSSAIYSAEWRECFARDEMPFELSTRLLLRALQEYCHTSVSQFFKGNSSKNLSRNMAKTFETVQAVPAPEVYAPPPANDKLENLADDTVLIAGGGPVGLLLATVLAHFGVKSVLLERNKTTTK
jgi:hypothetical protein